MSEPDAKLTRWAWPAIGLVLVVLALFAPGWIAGLRATHGAVAAYTRLIAAANAADVEGVRRLCSVTYLESHTIRAAKEGGIVGLPRNIHKNFQAWRHGLDVWLCPTNRVGPVYRFIDEGGEWKFDGPAGLLVAGGQVIAGDEGGGSP